MFFSVFPSLRVFIMRAVLVVGDICSGCGVASHEGSVGGIGLRRHGKGSWTTRRGC